MDKIIYMFWTGDNPITENRKLNFLRTSVVNHNFKVKLLYKEDIKRYELPDSPYHPAYQFLSETHKADYLRCYFMHYYGGGYSDIKLSPICWDNAWDNFFASDALMCGYSEINPSHIAPQTDKSLELEMKQNFYKLIGNGCYLAKPQSVITQDWLDKINRILDIKLDDLRDCPSSFPQDTKDCLKNDGSVSKYPLRWAEICGEVFHNVIYKYKNYVDYSLPPPITQNYR